MRNCVDCIYDSSGQTPLEMILEQDILTRNIFRFELSVSQQEAHDH